MTMKQLHSNHFITYEPILMIMRIKLKLLKASSGTYSSTDFNKKLHRFLSLLIADVSLEIFTSLLIQSGAFVTLMGYGTHDRNFEFKVKTILWHINILKRAFGK